MEEWRRADEMDVEMSQNTSERSEAAQQHHGAATNPANTSGEGTPVGVSGPASARRHKEERDRNAAEVLL